MTSTCWILLESGKLTVLLILCQYFHFYPHIRRHAEYSVLYVLFIFLGSFLYPHMTRKSMNNNMMISLPQFCFFLAASFAFSLETTCIAFTVYCVNITIFKFCLETKVCDFVAPFPLSLGFFFKIYFNFALQGRYFYLVLAFPRRFYTTKHKSVAWACTGTCTAFT
jgi:hypothetical protein